jgi:hypothetical protein
VLSRSIALTGDGARAVVRTAYGLHIVRVNLVAEPSMNGLHIVRVNLVAEPSMIAVPALPDFAIVGTEPWVDQVSRASEGYNQVQAAISMVKDGDGG